MGYYTRYSLWALNPTTLEPVDPSTWSTSYLDTILASIAPRYSSSFPVGWDFASGSLFEGEPHTWYEYEPNLEALSQKAVQFVWALQGQGEDPDDQWVLYAYRGSSYQVKQEPWIPPPPDMSRLPEVILVSVPKDPPTAEEALQKVVGHNIHAESCPVYDHPTGFDLGQCDCPWSIAKAALEALRVGRARG